MNKSILSNIVAFVSYILLQVILLKNIVLFDRGFIFAYVGFLVLLPVEGNRLVYLLLGFTTGLIIDMFYDSLGIHVAACVAMMFIRAHWLNLLTPQGGFDSGVRPSIRLNGWQWFAGYALPLIFVHHAFLFYIEASGMGLFWFSTIKIIYSTFFTFIVLMIIQYLFYNRRRTI